MCWCEDGCAARAVVRHHSQAAAHFQPALALVVVVLLAVFPAGVPAQECGVTDVDAGGVGLYGLESCPCLTPPPDFQGETWEYRSDSGFGAAGPDGPNAFNVTLNDDGLGLFIDGVEQDYGHLCGTHDWGTEAWCSNMTDPAQLNSWCSQTWCYVDAENCDLANSQTSYFPELKLHYSYAACASENTFSSDATLIEDSGEGARKKLKEIIAITLIEEITGMPTHDTDMQLLSTLGKIDTWDIEDVRQGMYVQGKHMLHNAEKGGYDPFACLHIADSRGMWYGLFPSLNVGMRMPDPATEDMYPVEVWYPFTKPQIQLAQRAAGLSSLGLYNTTCTDANMHCRWPTWEQCDGFGDNAACNSSTCCMTDQLYFEKIADSIDESRSGDLVRLQQYDPRIRAWYYNAPIQYALTGQMFAWSDIMIGLDHAGYEDSHRLSISATAIIPGDQGRDGLQATPGTCLGGWYSGFDFSAAPQTLTVMVDGVDISIVLSTDLSSIDAGVAALDAGLGNAATASLTVQSRILIESTSNGGSSMVAIDHTDPVAQMLSFANPMQSTGVPASAGTLVVERVPHRAVGSTSPLNVLDPAPWVGFDFTEENDELILTVDGANFTINLDTNLDSYADAATVITAGLGGAAAATVDAEGKYMTITSSTTGPSSYVRLGDGNSARVRKMLCPVIKSVLAIDLYLDRISDSLEDTFQDDIVYIVERSTGLLVAESAGEGVMDHEETFGEGHSGYALRKCAVNAETDLIRSSALQLENIVPKWSTMSLKLDATHLVDSRVYRRDPTEDGFGIDWLIVVVQTMQCPIGQALRTLLLNVECTQCNEGQISSDGLECIDCPAGMVPNAEQSECNACPDGMEQATDVSCVPCVGNQVSTGGNECSSCDFGLIADDEKIECHMCPDGLYFDQDSDSCRACVSPLIPNEVRSACVCPAKTFNSTRPLRCYIGDFVPPRVSDTSTYRCHSCEDLDCVEDCFENTLIVSEGWVISLEASAVVPIFECRNSESCPGGEVGAVNTTDCADKYGGLLCGVCVDDYVLKKDGSCAPCGSTTVASSILLVFIAVFILFMIVTFAKVIYNYVVMLQEIYELSKDLQVPAMGKSLLGLVQVIGSLSVSLSIKFPGAFSDFVENFVGVFRLDIGSLFKFGCVSSGAYTSSLAGMIALLLSVAFVTLIIYLYRQRTAKYAAVPGRHNCCVKLHLNPFVHHEDPSHDAREHVKALFDRFDKDGAGINVQELSQIVRDIDPDQTDAAIQELFDLADQDPNGRDDEGLIDFDEFFDAVQNPDVSAGSDLNFQQLVLKKQFLDIRDASSSHMFIIVFLLYPSFTNKIFEGLACRIISDDVSVLYVDYEISCESTYYMFLRLFLILLLLLWPIGVPATLYWQMNQDKEKILAEDPDTLQKFKFALGDYKTTHWYWEIVELSRKLMLTGLISLFGRGSVAQVVAATCVSFFYFALVAREQPYNARHLNLVKIFTESQLFGILLILVVLQTNHRGLDEEILQEDEYGMIQIVLALSVVPVVAYLMKNAIKETTGLVEGVIKTEKGSPRDVNAFEAETTNPLDEDDGIMADKGDSL